MKNRRNLNNRKKQNRNKSIILESDNNNLLIVRFLSGELKNMSNIRQVE